MKNRFEFLKTGSCVNVKIQNIGINMEPIHLLSSRRVRKRSEKGAKEFNEDLNELLEMYVQNLSNVDMY